MILMGHTQVYIFCVISVSVLADNDKEMENNKCPQQQELVICTRARCSMGQSRISAGSFYHWNEKSRDHGDKYA